MLIKTFTSTILLFSLFASPVSTSANILDDLKNGFGQGQDKIGNKIKDAKNQNPTELEDSQTETKKICKIQKGYAVKHFENRQLERGKQIEQKISSINKIKELLGSNKIELGILDAYADSLIKLLNQKLELLNLRLKTADAIDCKDSQNASQAKLSLQDLNQKLNSLDKDIRSATRDFSFEVQQLIIKLKQPKTEEEKK
jgi:hypothetical protein